MANTVYMSHTFKLNEPKSNIIKYIKGINATPELANFLNYLTKKEVPVKDIGIMLKSKCPFIVNYDFSKEALLNKRPLFYSVKELTSRDEKMLKVYLHDLLNRKVAPLEEDLTNYDREIIQNLKNNFRDIQLTSTEISSEVLESDFEVSVLWGAYISYLLTKSDYEFTIEETPSITKRILLQKLESLGENIISEEELKLLTASEEEWDSKYIDLVKEDETVSYEYGKVYSQGKTHNEQFGYTFLNLKLAKTNFRLKNNGSMIGCMSDVLDSGDKPFSININTFFEHTLSDKYEGCIIVNISTTGWINSEDLAILDTTEKSSLYICPNSNNNNYIRLEVVNSLEEDKLTDKKNTPDKKQYKIVSSLSDSDKLIFENLLGRELDLDSILSNPRKYTKGRLDNNLAFIGIPIAAPLKSSVKDYAEPGLSIKDKTLFYDLVFEKLIEQGLNIEKEEYLNKINTTKDLKSSVDFNSKFVQIHKAQYLNQDVDTYVIAYWGNDSNDYKIFKDFIENLKVLEKSTETILTKISDNEYTMNTSNKSLNIKLIKCSTGNLTELLRPQSGSSITKKDIEIYSLLAKGHIIKEFANNRIDILKKSKNMIISNIVEIPAYQNHLRNKKFDPCHAIRVAFASLGLNIQVLNETLTIKEEKQSRLKKIDELNKIIAKQELELEVLNGNTKVVEKENLATHREKIKKLKKELKDNSQTLKSAINTAGKKDTSAESTKLEVFKSCFLDCLSKKTITAKIETEKFLDGILTIFSFAIVEMAGEQNILLLSKYDRDGLFVKDISCDKEDKTFPSEWIRAEDFPVLANRYLTNGKNKKIDEHKVWRRIESEINSINSKENILLISASERKLLKDLTNSKITKGIRALNGVESLSIVRINDFSDAPFGSVYGVSTDKDGVVKLSPKNDQGLFKKNNNIYYSKSGRGDTLKTAGSLTKTKFAEDQFLASRKSIEFCIVSNHLERNDEVASLVHALRQFTIAFEVATNKPYTLHIVEQLAKEFKN